MASTREPLGAKMGVQGEKDVAAVVAHASQNGEVVHVVVAEVTVSNLSL